MTWTAGVERQFFFLRAMPTGLARSRLSAKSKLGSSNWRFRPLSCEPPVVTSGDASTRRRRCFEVFLLEAP